MPSLAYMPVLMKLHEQDLYESEVPEERRRTGRGIEVGHIFYFGTKYSAAMNATVTNADGETVPVHMGSYGIGVSRLVGGIIEASHENGIIGRTVLRRSTWALST